jgi:Tol biopolymer transport system component
MPLALGTRLGPYEISSALGAGGMGEVYRARDTRLERTVAVKVLPLHLSNDSVRKQRFEREARAISGLNHPNICTLHDVGSQDGVDFLVMECVEGETLAKRLGRGPLPLEQVLKYGAQIADALDKAHRNGVVHRDLKPGNIMLTTGGVKLLDFGLAKPADPLGTGATMTATAPLSPVTAEGTIVGTFQYMSPEQVEGKEVDGRSDIFSLGAVLYEMVTGKYAFEGKSQLSVASAILEREPEPIGAVKPMTPPALEHVIRKCLAKNPEDRWQSAADIKHELDWIAQLSTDQAQRVIGPGKKRVRLTPLVLALGALLAAGMGVAAGYLAFGGKASWPVIRATLDLPANVTLITLGDEAGAPALSRDGRSMVFVGVADGKQMLYLRRLDSSAAKPLPGTEGGKFPFWSPDGRSVGFFADQQLKRLDIAGGPPMSLAPATDGRGGSWMGNTIIFSPSIYDPIYRIPASGGKATAVTELNRSEYTTHRWPNFLPDGKHFLYLAAHHLRGKQGTSAIFAGNMEGGAPKLILQTNGSAFYASGKLLYFREGSLMAQDLDLGRLELAGDATLIGPVMRESGNWGVIAAASDNGVLLFQTPGEAKYPTYWFDRSGKGMGPVPLAGPFQDLRLSPDGTQAAIVTSEGPAGSVYICDLKAGGQTRLTFSNEVGWYAVWSPDGKRVAYSAQNPGEDKTSIYVKRADGGGERELLLSSGYADHPTDWTRDGKYLVINRGPIAAQRVWIVPLFGDRKPFALYPNANYDHFDGRVSPDGKWIVYMSSESGPQELYITSFPNAVGKWQVSAGGVSSPGLWRADSGELYFVSVGGNLMVASIHASAESITLSNVHALFRSPFLNNQTKTVVDVDPKDAQRFIGSAAPDTNSLPINVITNWKEALKTE